MKLEMVYVAIDADNVGEQVGNAVLNNDEAQLSDLSSNINSGVGVFSQWAEGAGGKVISSGSDEAILKVPASEMEKLDEIRSIYKQKTGFSISVGIGSTVAESAKALIYAKVNGKDQIVDYSPEIERAMQQAVTGNMQEEVEEETEKEVEEEMGEEEVEEETEEIDVPADEVDGDYGSEEMADGQPEDEQEMGEEEEFIHDAQENREDEADEDIIEDDMEEEVDEETEEIAEDIAEEMEEDSTEDVDVDGQSDISEEHGEIEAEDDLDGDGDIEHEEAMAAEMGEEEEYTDEDDYDDEIMEEPEQELSDSIESEMGEELPQEMEEEMEGGMDDESLRQVIFQSLQSFKENKEFLDSLSQSNPDLYGSLIYCLQAMIEMARQLGYGNVDEEMADEMEEDDMLGEEDGIASVDFDNDDVDADFEKSEKIKNLAKNFSEMMVSLLKKEEGDEPKGIEELKQEFKKKIQEKMKSKSSGGSKKKKKAGVKKPGYAKKKKDKKESKEDNDGSFCARSHQKMRSSGKDCRANEDKNSPLCAARRKNNCRGKNEEKGSVQKSEKLQGFLKKKELEKSRLGTAEKQTTKKIRTKQRPVGALNLNREMKVEDPETGKPKNVDASRGLSLDGNGNPVKPEGASPKQKQKKGVAPRPSKI